MASKEVVFREWICDRCGMKQRTESSRELPAGWINARGTDLCLVCHRGSGEDRPIEESAFHEAIRSNPHDITAQLIYADWLDDRGDERGEYLRLLAESERVQVRLHALRQHLDPGWLDLVAPCERATNLARLNGLLQAFELLNEGVDHVCSYHLDQVLHKGTLDESLAAYFEEVWSISGGAEGQELRQGGWTISKTEVADGWEHVRRLCLEYFFHQEFSPTRPARSTPADYCVETTLALLQQWAGGSIVRIFDVKASSSRVFYDLVYADVLIQAGDKLLLLHLGWSD